MTVTQYDFTFKELARALMHSAGIHEGRWQLAFSIDINVGQFGETPADVKPGAAFLVNGIALQRKDDGAHDAPMTFDAAVENPRV
jgi:hypothetical protein